MYLQHIHILRDDRRNDRSLKRTGCGDNTLCFKRALGGLHPKPQLIGQFFHAGHLNTAANWCIDHFGIFNKVIRHPFFSGERTRLRVGEFQRGKTVMPGRAVGNQ